MRKFLSTLLITGVVLAGLAAVASGAGSARCGTLYTSACTIPKIHIRKIHKCKKASSTFTVPKIRITSNSGIRKVRVKLGSKVLKSKRFRGHGPSTYTITGLKVNTTGLTTGDTITISVRDIRGKTRTSTVRFRICTEPPFTG